MNAITRFKDLSVGDSFDFIAARPALTSFHRRCTKVSARKYKDDTGQAYTVGSVSVPVFHVSKAGTPTDLRAIIDTMAETIASAWHKDAMRAMGTAQFYLWYRAAREGERVALCIHSEDRPNDLYSRDIAISNAWTREQATRQIAARMSVLPICG